MSDTRPAIPIGEALSVLSLVIADKDKTIEALKARVAGLLGEVEDLKDQLRNADDEE